MAKQKGVIRDIALIFASIAVWDALTTKKSAPSAAGESRMPSASLALAYAEVDRSYSTLQEWLFRADARIQTLQATALALTLGFLSVVVAVQPKTDFNSGWFYAGCAFFVFAMGLASVSTQLGSFEFPSPYLQRQDKWTEFSESDYMAFTVYFAAEHFNKNRQLVYRRAQIANAILVSMVVESTLMITWLLRAT